MNVSAGDLGRLYQSRRSPICKYFGLYLKVVDADDRESLRRTSEIMRMRRSCRDEVITCVPSAFMSFEDEAASQPDKAVPSLWLN